MSTTTLTPAVATEKKATLGTNLKNYDDLYSKNQAFLRYPADWILRFHNMFLNGVLPQGAKVLDYGCGSANNAIFFIKQGYDVTGLDVAPSAINLIKQNLKDNHLSEKLVENFSIIPTDTQKLSFQDNTFDFIISNQVLYYLPTKQHIQTLCKEFARVLKPNGIVFFTVMGPKNYYITHRAKNIINNRVYEITIEEPTHRLAGLKEFIYLIRDEEDLKDHFSQFECLTTGYFDEKMFDLLSNFHWIFAGKNKK